MSILYISDSEAKVSFIENRVMVVYPDGVQHSLPVESVESITLLTKAHITTQCIEECLRRGIPVAFLSKGGRYFGRLVSTGHANAALQRQQSALYDTNFAVELSRRIISAKTRNQLVVMHRYAKSKGIDLHELEDKMRIYIKKVPEKNTIEELIGYEGQCAKLYFQGLSKCIDSEFAFRGRSRRPPRDAFNSLISLGYSVLMNEIYNEIETKGLHPYFGFMHRDAEKHPTLASDMLEEWRAVIVDSMAMSLVNGHEITKDSFKMGDDTSPGCFLTKDGLKIFLKKMEKKLQTRAKYLSYIENAVPFRRAISLQLGRLSEAIKEGDASVYEPIVIR